MKNITYISIRSLLTWLLSILVFIIAYFIINTGLIISQFDLILEIFQGKQTLTNSAFITSKIAFCVFLLPAVYIAFGHKHGFLSSLNYIINNNLDSITKFIADKVIEHRNNEKEDKKLIDKELINLEINEQEILDSFKNHPSPIRFCIKFYIRKSGIIDKLKNIENEMKSKSDQGESLESSIIQIYLKSTLKDQFKPSLLYPTFLIIMNIGLLIV